MREHGLQLAPSPEGKYRATDVAGVPALTVDPTASRFMYLRVAPWFTCSDVELALEYFDCGTGAVTLRYDSLDTSFHSGGNEVPGAWKEAGDRIVCQGTNAWRRWNAHLPDARFSRACNGQDIRLEVTVEGDFPIGSICLTPAGSRQPLPADVVGLVKTDGSVTWHEAQPDERYILAAANCSLTLSPQGIVALQDRKAGSVLIPDSPPCEILSFDIRKRPGGETLSFGASSMPVRMRLYGGPQPSAVEYDWGFEGAWQASARIERVGDELVACRMSVGTPQNSTSVGLRTSVLCLQHLRLGPTMEDDSFVAPGYGRHGTGVWHNLAAEDPGLLSMATNWLAMYDDKTGLGLLLDTPDACDVASKTVKGNDGLQTGFVLDGVPQHPVTAYLLVHPGDWHRVADVYRERIAARAPQPVIPAWAYDCDSWGSLISNDVENGFAELPRFFEARYGQQGHRLLNIYRAMFDGPWCYCGVYPYPCPWYGTVDELREANQRIRDHGGRTLYYINYQLGLFDGTDIRRIGPCARSFLQEGLPSPQDGQPGAAPKGRSYVGLPADQLPMERGSRAWSDRDLFWASWYVENLAVDGIYWDQLSCIAGGLPETAWNLQRITDECRKLNPSFVTGGEGLGETHGRCLTFGLASATQHRAELYRYTFPNQLVMDGTSNAATNWSGGDKRFNVVFLNGCRFDNSPSDPTFRHNTFLLRQRTKQLLYQAQFRDTVGVTLALPPGNEPAAPQKPGLQLHPWGGIQAKRFVLNTANSALILVNAVNEPGASGARAAVRTAGLGPIRSAWAFLWDGSLQKLPFTQVNSSEAAIELPRTMQSTCILANHCEPLVDPMAPTMVAAGTTVPVSASVTNLDATPLSGKVRWETPSGWTATQSPFGPVPPGQTVKVSGRLTVGADAVRRVYDLFCVAESGQSSGRRYVGLPVVPTPYVDWSWGPNGRLCTTLTNLEPNAVEVTVEVSLPENCTAAVTPRTQRLSVPAWGKAQATFGMEGAAAMQEAVAMRIGVTAAGHRQEIPVRLFPTICNGSFEIDRAGDGKPEYWTTYDYSGKIGLELSYPLIRLDSERPFDGRTCLRVDPLGGSAVSVYPVGTMLAPDTSYRATAYLRVPDGGDAKLLWQHQPLRLVGGPDVNGWQRFELTGNSGPVAAANNFCFQNLGKTPVWLDAVSFTPVE